MMKSFGTLVLAIACTLGAAPAAMAQTGSTMSENNGATTGLGSSHRFPTQQAASSHCPTDIIVWSAGASLTYHLPASPLYGKSAGFYACKMEADGAGFHASQN